MPAFLEPINIPTRINKPPIKFGTRNTWLNPSIRDLKNWICSFPRSNDAFLI